MLALSQHSLHQYKRLEGTMKNLMLTAVAVLSLSSFNAAAQSYERQGGNVVRYPVYERAYEPASQICREVVTDSQYNAGGAAVGAIVGYALGSGYDRRGSRYTGYYGHSYHGPRGGYYNDRLGGYSGYSGRAGGAVVGAVIGSHVGRTPVTTTICEQQGNRGYREVLVGHRVITRYANGDVREQFIPTR